MDLCGGKGPKDSGGELVHLSHDPLRHSTMSPYLSFDTTIRVDRLLRCVVNDVGVLLNFGFGSQSIQHQQLTLRVPRRLGFGRQSANEQDSHRKKASGSCSVDD